MPERGRTAGGVIVLDRVLIDSPAFQDLGEKGIKVLLVFFGKRKIVKKRDKKRHQDRVEILNNGELVYTYDEAEKRGITRPAFVRALDDLIGHGFLDIAQTGSGLFKSTTFYSLSERWRTWGTSSFVPKPRPKRRGQMGFQRGHPPYLSTKKRSNRNGTGSSNGNGTGKGEASNENDTGSL